MTAGVPPRQDAWAKALTSRSRRSEKSWGLALALSICLGWLGVDRFYLGLPLSGSLKLVTLGCGGLWWAVDVALLLANRLRDGDGYFV